MHDAKTHLSKLVARVQAGEEIVIGRSGKPVARLVPYAGARAPRMPGGMRGEITVADDFDRTPEWLIDAFEGRES